MNFDINKPPVVNRAYKILTFTDEVEWPCGDSKCVRIMQADYDKHRYESEDEGY